MILFDSDYTQGTLPEIMDQLVATNMEQTHGYGKDPYCERATVLIKEVCKAPNCEVHYFVGGTQTNATLIAAALRTYQGVITVDTGHIHTHETGAVEAGGHKVLAYPGVDGKLNSKQVEAIIVKQRDDESYEHIVQPKMVYISHPTELGTLYTAQEIKDLSEVCKRYGLYFYLDGARMSYGLAAKGTDVDLPLIAKYTDAFYIGGTKVGALFGEALVINHELLKEDFRYVIKQGGGMLAKGRLLGVQFETLFTDGLYFKAGEHAIAMANKLSQGLEHLGISCYANSPTNQIFPIFEDQVADAIATKFSFAALERVDDTHRAVRFCTSWATKEKEVDQLLEWIKQCLNKVIQ